jgi:hypothetical protein
MLTPGRNYVNTTVRLAINFQDDDGNDIDPATVTLKTCSPSGVKATYGYPSGAIIRLNLGDFYYELVPTESGRWAYRWESTGTGSAIAIEDNVLVHPSPFYDDPYPDYS